MDVGGYGVRKGMCLQVSKHSLLFLVTTLIRTRNVPSAYHFGNYKALQNSVSETRAEIETTQMVQKQFLDLVKMIVEKI